MTTTMQMTTTTDDGAAGTADAVHTRPRPGVRHRERDAGHRGVGKRVPRPAARPCSRTGEAIAPCVSIPGIARATGPPEIELPPKITRRGSASSGAKAEAPKGERTPPWGWVALVAVVGAAGYLRLETAGTLSEPTGGSSTTAEVPALHYRSSRGPRTRAPCSRMSRPTVGGRICTGSSAIRRRRTRPRPCRWPEASSSRIWLPAVR